MRTDEFYRLHGFTPLKRPAPAHSLEPDGDVFAQGPDMTMVCLSCHFEVTAGEIVARDLPGGGRRQEHHPRPYTRCDIVRTVRKRA